MTEVITSRGVRRRDWILIFFLAFAYVLSGVDRQILAFVAPAVKSDLALTDFQLGLLQGFAFSLFYAVAGMPMGVLIDRFSRTKVMGAAVAFWSAMTLGCGLAPSLALLAVARMGVGAGEAALTPGAYSMMADVFPRRLLGRASMIYALGAPVSVAVAAAISGWVLAAGNADGRLALPVIGNFAAWRVAFAVAALPGIVVSVGLFLLRDPTRKGGHVDKTSSSRLFTFLAGRGRSHLVFALASTAVVGIHYAVSAWSPIVLSRSFDWSPMQVASALGSVGLAGGTLGCLMGGFIAERALRQASTRPLTATMTVMGIALLVLAIACLAIPNAVSFIALVGTATTITSMMLMLMPTFLQTITPPALRGRMTGFFMFANVGIGAGVGPTLVGAVSGHLLSSAQILSSLGSVFIALSLVSVGAFAVLHRLLPATVSIQSPEAAARDRDVASTERIDLSVR